MTGAKDRTEIHVTVSFPITKKGPFQEKVSPETTVGTVRDAAMQHFEVQDDSQFTYVLAHDGKEQDNNTTIGDIAGHAEAVKFTLVKKITQG
ncbi:MAG: hypothetical protein M3P18_19775 [Actinomycetota bacterium]|nr:hypothetical protein [Actinomycetota bacterium]